MSALIEQAWPKVNLSLRVLGKRADGYHELDSLVAFAADAGDVIALDPGQRPGVRVSGPFGASIAGENLISVTLARIAAEAPGLALGDIHLTKNLPIAAGIGGGSADAAAVIRAVQRINADAARDVDWHRLATQIGADVPVCLASRAQMMRGIGEQLSLLPPLPELYCVLVNPLAAVPPDKTAQVFRRLGAPRFDGVPGSPGDPGADLASTAAMLTFLRQSGNDLTPAACAVVPEIADVLQALSQAPRCELARLSGGGPTCFGLFATLSAARAAADWIKAREHAWWVVPSRLV